MIPLRLKTEKRPKHMAAPTVLDGIRFDSTSEAKRYAELLLLERAAEISGLEVHVRFPIDINGQRICSYECDFMYRTKAGRVIVEDVKGAPLTAVYRIKKKLLMACHGIEILETRNRRR